MPALLMRIIRRTPIKAHHLWRGAAVFMGARKGGHSSILSWIPRSLPVRRFSASVNTDISAPLGKSRSAPVDIDSIDAELRRWPTPETREAINETVHLLTDDAHFLQQALKHSVDKGLWHKVLPVFRRAMVTTPNTLYKTYDELSELIHAINASLDPNNVEGLFQLKNQLFKGILTIVEDQFAADVALVRAMLSASDLRAPSDWYPQARLRKRKFIYHGGPTNSGKTYQALKRLREADPAKGGGMYCGPLRLLALEVYEGLTRQGIYCDLLTGQEKRNLPESTHVSCTVELVSVTREFDVAVVDEIQMIANPQRGHSWTRALQGLLANEIHVCGGLEASERVQSIVEEMGDSFELVKYDRLSPLVVADESLRGDYSKVRKGDCIVAFSRNDLYSIKAEIERLTPHKCCLVYGALPPETRSMQARLFNDENTGFDVLVASDAIGMGLNLNIRRVIFHTTMKRGPPVSAKRPSIEDDTWLHPSYVKQIAGRAGRLSSKYKFGEVTSWQEHDLAYIRACLQLDVPQVPFCGIFPSVELLEEFSEHVKVANNGVPVSNLSSLMERFVEAARLDGKYGLSDHADMRLISNWLYTIPLSLQDRFTFANAPVNARDQLGTMMIYQYAAQYAMKRPVAINVHLPENRPVNVLELNALCAKNNILELYVWLSLRFPDWFVEHDKCLEMKRRCVEMIEGALEMENLGHKFCHANEYRLVRQKNMQREGDIPLPPLHYGNVRQIAGDLMKSYSQDDLFCFPHVIDQPIQPNWKRQDSPRSGGKGRPDRPYNRSGDRQGREFQRGNDRGDAKGDRTSGDRRGDSRDTNNRFSSNGGAPLRRDRNQPDSNRNNRQHSGAGHRADSGSQRREPTTPKTSNVRSKTDSNARTRSEDSIKTATATVVI